MSKIKVKSIISKKDDKINEIVVDALKSDNKIIFYEENNTLMKIEFNGDLLSIRRDNSEMKLIMNFQDGKTLDGLCEIKTLNSNIGIKTTTKRLIIINHKIEIEYDMYMDNEYNGTFNYKLEWSD